MDKFTFFTGQPVFSQLLNLIPAQLVREASREYQADRYCKTFMSSDHLVSMLYAGFFQCTSLRELTTGLQANAGRLNHLGLKQSPCKSTLADANHRRSADFFARIYHQLYDKYFGLPDSRLKSEESKLFIIDSTTIGLFSQIMQGAGSYKANGKKKGGVKAHMMIDSTHDIPAFIHITEAKEHDLTFLKELYVPDKATVVFDKAYINYNQFLHWGKREIKWVTRLRNSAVYRPVWNIPIEEEEFDRGILSDRIVVLGRPSNQKKSPLTKARLIEFYDVVKKRTFSFITNDTLSPALVITEIYRRRWQIETLFKRIKQRYPLKYFLGDSPNAVKIQIWAALLCDLLVKVVQRQVNKLKKKPWAYASIAAMIKHHLMTYIDLIAFLINPEKLFYKTNERTSQLTLFDRGAYF